MGSHYFHMNPNIMVSATYKLLLEVNENLK